MQPINPALDLKEKKVNGENLLNRLLQLDFDTQAIISAKIDALYEVEILKQHREHGGQSENKSA